MTPEETQETKETQQEAEAPKEAETVGEKRSPEPAGNPAETAQTEAGGQAETEGHQGESPEETPNPSEPVYTFTQAQMEKMEQAARQLETVRDQFIRVTAEYDNYRKRTTREKETLYQDAKIDTIRAFLAVYDDLERAVKAESVVRTEDGEEHKEDSPHKKGLEMIFQKYRTTLQNLGVTEIAALNQPFDPEKHNAVMHIEDENYGENTVSQVFQAGFALGDKVIRHAMVQVAN